MRVLTLEEMERVAGGGKPKARARPHKSSTSSGHAGSGASSCSGSSGGTCTPPLL